MTAPASDYGSRVLDKALDLGAAGQRQFKRHKTLPRPRNERGLHDSPTRAANYNLVLDTSQPTEHSSQSSSPRTLKHQPRRIGTGPDLPPTPPNQSRTSSSGQSAVPSSPPEPETEPSLKSYPSTVKRHPATPPDQRSPPTPDFTPPQPAVRRRGLRHTSSDRGASRTTTTNSRTESFKTAREEPVSSEDEGVRSSIRPEIASAGTSQTTVLRIPDSKSARLPQPQALDIALERLRLAPEENYTPRTRAEFGKFDGEWSSPSEVDQEWDDNLQRAVTVKKRPETSTPTGPTRQEDVNPRGEAVATNNLKTNRQHSLREAPVLKTPPRAPSNRSHTLTTSHSNSNSPTSVDVRRSSGVSTQSNTTAVVEAVLMDIPPRTLPRRQQTLRHVQKQRILRGTTEQTPEAQTDNFSPSTPSKPPQSNLRPQNKSRHESLASNSTSNSISSSRARREVWRSGSIPVVVVPDRHSSHRSVSSREPSLRSTSSKRSKRPLSVGSAVPDELVIKGSVPLVERQSRHSRTQSDVHRSDERTIDFPPTIPVRSSSLSAPTSRNTSRAGSMTANSIQARNAVQSLQVDSIEQTPQIRVSTPEPDNIAHSPGIWSTLADEEANGTLGVDRYDNTTPARKYSSRNTPFSVASVETSGTAPIVSEAQAIHMYPHQNSSLVMVHHSAKPSDASDATNGGEEVSEESPIQATMLRDLPVTPPQPQLAFNDVESPLRNPRAPPDPPANFLPAINFIPATPSGLTPAQEKSLQLENFSAAMAEAPVRRPSIVRRALGRRRHSVDYPPSASRTPNFLMRTFSLSRGSRKLSKMGTRSSGNSVLGGKSTYPQTEEKPVEQDKLHPFWRPQWLDDDEACNCRECLGRRSEDQDEIFRYPPIDNRPPMPKRSLSARMKKTFAIMPVRDNPQYLADDLFGPERRTIRRTPSGNLRVMRHRSSIESLKRPQDVNGRPHTSPEGDMKRRFWRGHSLRRRASKEHMRRSSIGSRLEDIQNIPRILSERRREKRSQELRQKISGPREVRDGVGDMIRSGKALERHNTIG